MPLPTSITVPAIPPTASTDLVALNNRPYLVPDLNRGRLSTIVRMPRTKRPSSMSRW